MADIESPVELRAWSLGAFHTVGFVLAVVLGVHLSGTLADKLGRLNTAIGVAAFLVLWALTWRITKAALLKMDPPIEDAESGEIVASMIVAGGWNGVAIFAAILLIAFAAILLIAAASAFAPS